MRQVGVVCLAVALALLGLSGVSRAQPPGTIQVQGTIRAVDCQASTLALETPGGSNVYRAAASAAIIVNSTGVPFCGLQRSLGAAANVWLTAIRSELVITRIDAVSQAFQPAPSPAAPDPAPHPAYPNPAYTYPAYPYPAYPYPNVGYPYGGYGGYPYYSYYPYYYPPLAGLVLGSIFVGGLAYLLVNHHHGYYRYPYYGSYYQHYYRPAFRPYYGSYRYAPAYTWSGRGWVWGGHHHR